MTTVAITALLGSTVAQAQETAASQFLQRSAQGDVTQQGGARRITGDMTQMLQAAITNGEVKHVILFIGDGMGDSEITVARNYAEGAGGYFKGIDAFPVTGQYTHYSLDQKSGKPAYVTDSAASGSAWSTGVKTYNNAVSVDITGKAHQTLLEMAKAAGLGTGDVTTSELQDATPAVQVAHVVQRSCYGPVATTKTCADNALENGGLGSITEQLLNTRADITLGGGAKTFDEVAAAGDWKGKTLMDQAKERGYTIVTNSDELKVVTAANQDKPVLGLFAPGNMPVRWSGPKASYHGNIEKAAVTCVENPDRPAAQPSLSEMTTKAIDLLKGNEKGFFLQVEGASIDKQDHDANACGQIGETVDLDEAVQVALDYAKKDGKTLVIVTADHAHSSQIIEHGSKAPGLTVALTTKDGSIMDVSYGNSESESQGHTGTQLRVAAFGPWAGNFAGLTDQTDMFFTIRDALKLTAD
ncbi:MAG TPA: alkaline phosphatase [Devosiaceae bacterium]|jgi:alkaline phosphatase